jgi:2-polyprenyl-6-methoxyphenol hydroxylase-like FAD-dependent oxidoreductase
MIIRQTTAFAAIATAIALLSTAPASAQTCSRQGNDVTCDDGRRGIFTGDAIIWADGTRSNLASQHPSVVIGTKPSVIVGQGVMVGSPSGKGVVPMENPSAQSRCPVLDGVAYCY